jgi:hypothetical protein
MAAKIDIFNLTLLRLGSLPILSPDDTSKRAEALRSVYDLVLDIVLRDHPWNFATRRASLALISEAPLFGYAYAFQLPENCLRVLGLLNVDTATIDPMLAFAIEGGQLLTDQASASIKYIERIDNPQLFDSRFCSTLASRLAAEVALQITTSPAIKKQMMDEYHYELSVARSIDAQEYPPEVYESNEWIDARA